MAKAPRPGRVKTRLCPPLTAEQSAALNICFLRDTTENLALVAISGSACGIISYTPVGDEALFDGLLPDDFALIAQRGNGFGERLLASAEDLLGCGFGAVCLIDSDSPTAPTSCFEQAVGALAQPGDRIVLGPSQDGGYYLIGLKHAHPEPFERINWSTSTVFEETVAAAEAAGIEVVRLQLWYDVDDQATLAVLEAELLDALPPAFASPVNGSPVLASSAVSSTRGYDATHSRRFLKSLRAAACG
jgi:rSAM/selenodomain-associated transferase 1